MSARRHPSRSRHGFTLVETIAAIVVLAALGSVAAVIIGSAVSNYTEAATAAQLHSEASVALDRIDRALREINRASSGPDIGQVTPASITWHGSSSLALAGSEVLLTADGGAAQVLLADVSAFSVQAYDESNSALAQNLSGSACDAVRRLAITLTIQRHGVSQTLRTKVFLRSNMSYAGVAP